VDYGRFVDRVADRTGLGRSEAERAIELTLETVGECMLDADARALSRWLPSPVCGLLTRRPYRGERDLDGFFRLLAEREGVTISGSSEHARIVCGAFGETAEPDAVAALRSHLPETLAALLEPGPRSSSRPPRPRRAEDRRTTPLSQGRPGSQRPVSEARADKAHAHSVARSDDPHDDTKLSSAQGTTQEREQETLAEGHPASKPLDEA